MEITHRVENEILIFAISERLDASTAPIAEETIKKNIERKHQSAAF
ncbi:MAG: hypothetical protein PVG96_21155 [Desulfobacterales bacterium]|jgi:hypothetical protein